ncbi:hypothetical protein HO173_003976 [Letharia columbiana]|uniref:Ankyrin repeat protein n=1 Tax=Letharia columbiana TaxID=112416 RepID=A0A8H6L6S1_9LECA|nr:uncharacterized protein HO173_003976 [Letharia columbiana]KAF6237775.1 hypothetical protein HO173_003976 [Letharia columbiana]
MPSLREIIIRAASKGHLEVLKRLLLPNPSYSLQEADTTLEKLVGIAARHCHSKVLEFCISLGTNVNDDAVRIGVLESSRLNVYQKVIAAGFDLNYDHDGTIGGPLIWATLTNHIPLATYLLDHGADVNRDLQNRVYRPLAKAAEKNSVAMIELFIRYGAQMDRSGALIVAAEHGNLEAVRCLVSHGADINLIRKSDTDLYMKTGEEDSALHKAVRGGHEDVVAFLVESGARLGLRDHQGNDALMMAVKMNSAELFQIIYDAQR